MDGCIIFEYSHSVFTPFQVTSLASSPDKRCDYGCVAVGVVGVQATAGTSAATLMTVAMLGQGKSMAVIKAKSSPEATTAMVMGLSRVAMVTTLSVELWRPNAEMVPK